MEKYIPTCLNSVLAQNYKNLEVVVINDGSTDGTEVICQEYAQKDERIKVFTRSNGGVAEATNMGLDKQTGDFVLFLDSDDYLAKDAIDKMVASIQESNADIVQSGVITETEEGQLLIKEQFEEQVIYGKKEILKKHLGEMIIGGNLAQKLFRAELFEGVRMPKGRNLADVSTMLKILPKCNIYKIIPDILYVAVKRNNSVSMAELNDSGYEDIMFYIDSIAQMGLENEEINWCIKYAKLKMLMMCYNRVHRSNRITGKVSKEKMILKIYSSEFDLWKKEEDIKNIELKQRMKMKIFRLIPRLYASMIC